MQQFRRLSILLAALAALSAVFAASASASGYQYSSIKFGSKGTGNGQFEEPVATTTDSAGNFWVVDSKSKSVQKFNSKGEFLLKITKGQSNFVTPTDVAIDTSGNAWVVDSGGNRIIDFSSTGTYLSEFGEAGSGPGQLGAPRNIAIDSIGNLWITEKGNHRVQEFSSTGKYIKQFGSYGTEFHTEAEGNGKFNIISGLAIDAENNVWVLDMNTLGSGSESKSFNRIEEFNSAGVFVKQIGTGFYSGFPSSFPGYDGLSIYGGNLWVVHADGHRVTVVNTEGGLYETFGGPKESEGSMYWPNSVTFDSSGNPWVVVNGGEGTSPPVMGLEKWVQPLATAATEAATGIKISGATLKGRIGPEATSTTYQFEYGTTTSYGSTAPLSPAWAGSSLGLIAVQQTISGLTPNTTYHYRVVAINGAGKAFGSDKTFTTLSVPSQLEALPIVNPFDGSPTSLSNFNTAWGILSWSTPALEKEAKGEDSSLGWRSLLKFPSVGGTHYHPTAYDVGSGVAAVVTLSEAGLLAERYFSLWLDMPAPTFEKTGYELRLTNTATETNTYTVTLVKWQAGVQTVLASKTGFTFEAGKSFALVDRGSTVSAWFKTGTEFTSVLSATDSSFESGKSGLEASGNSTFLMNFKAGAL